MLADDRHRVVAQEGRPPRHHLVEHRAQGVEVGLRRHLAAHGLLGRHVRHRAHHHPLAGQPRAVERQRQPEVADLGHALAGQPDVARLQVAVDDAFGVGELQPHADLAADLQAALDGHAVVLGLLDQVLHVAAAHELGDHVGLAVLSPRSKTVTMWGWEPSRPMACASRRMRTRAVSSRPFGLDQGEGHVAVEQGVVGQVDLLLAALAQELLHLVAAADEGGGRLRGSRCCGRRGGSRGGRGTAARAERLAALPAELGAGFVDGFAGWAHRLEWRGALGAELAPRGLS